MFTKSSPSQSREFSRARVRIVAAIGLTTASAALLSGCFAPSAGEAAVGFDELQSATVQLEAFGRFVEPGTLEPVESGGRGTGFFINSSGLAVTNNHVVGGAGTIDVWVGGDQSETYSARVLGSSECLDLAVVQVEGSGFPFLSWYEGEIENGLEVYLAGFPLGDPEYTLTKGIVSKADIQQDAEYASLEHVVEHTAKSRGGNSGGPLVSAEGRVVGVHFSGWTEFDYQWAISREEALPVLQNLIDGESVQSLGLNVRGLEPDEDGVPYGVWVTGVTAGGPGDLAGIKSGDVILDLAGIQLAKTGTLEEYCEVIKTQGGDATIDATVYRPSEEAIYEGQFNGRELELTSGGNANGGDTPQPAPVGGFVTVSDETGSVSVSVPDTWSDVTGPSATDETGNAFVTLNASPNIEAFKAGYDTPGVQIAASQGLVGSDIGAQLAQVTNGVSNQCTLDRSGPYDDGVYVGQFEYYVNCGGVDTDFVVIVVEDAEATHQLIFVAQLVSAADKSTTLDAMLASFIAKF